MKTIPYTQVLQIMMVFIIAGFQALKSQSVTNTSTGMAYSTIQAAIDAAETSNGHTISVAAGHYYENVLVNKQLTILGPKAGIDGNDASRGTGEAVVHPAAINFTDGVNWASGGKIFNITADNVTVDGLTMDGDNPNLTSGYVINGADIDCESGISSHGGYAGDDPDLAGDNLVLKNNIIKNLMGFGIIMWSATLLEHTQSSQINHNKLQNIYSTGIYLAQNYYATIEYNTMSALPVGVLVYLYFNPNNSPIPGRIQNNTMTVETMYRNDGNSVTALAGVHIIFLYNGITGAWDFSKNTINNITTRSTGSHGIVVSHCEGQAFSLHDNSISNFENGYLLHSSVNFWTPGALPAAVSGGVVSHCTYGVTAINLSEWVGPNLPTDHYQLDGLSIQNSTVAGVFVASQNVDYESGFGANTPTLVYVDINNCNINGGAAGILNEGNLGYAYAHNNNLSGNSAFAINNLSNNPINATCNWYGSWTGPSVVANPGGMGDAVSANVTFDPWLVNGTDAHPSVAGFQPMPGSCVPIKCGNKGKNYILCHKGKILCVGYDDALIHLSHGDPLGACSPADISDINAASSIRNIAEPVTGLQVRAWPNPAEDIFNIRVTGTGNQKITLRILDASGRTMFVNNQLTHNSTIQAGRGFRRGMYMVEIIQGNERATLKLMKQ